MEREIKTKGCLKAVGAIVITITMMTVAGMNSLAQMSRTMSIVDDHILDNVMMVENTTGKVGDIGHLIQIMGSWNDNIAAYSIVIYYDNASITPISITLDGTVAEDYEWQFGGWGYDIEHGRPYLYAGALFDFNQMNVIPPGSGKLFNLIVDINEEAIPGTTVLDVAQNVGPEYKRSIYALEDGSTVEPLLIDGVLTILSPSSNQAPKISNPNPFNGQPNVPINLSELSVLIEDREGDNFHWTIVTSPNLGSSSGTGYNGTKTCSIAQELQYNTLYTWYVNATDDGSGNTTRGVFTFTTIKAPEADLDCGDCDLNWTRVKPGSTVTGTFQVMNVGEPGSKLDWSVCYGPPGWGNWSYIPPNGFDLPPGTPINVTVTIVAPEKKNCQYNGNITICNLENPNDTCIIPVSLKTPRSVSESPLFVVQFFEKIMKWSPLLAKFIHLSYKTVVLPYHTEKYSI